MLYIPFFLFLLLAASLLPLPDKDTLRRHRRSRNPWSIDELTPRNRGGRK